MLFTAVELIIGAGLVINCTWGLVRGEDMYDSSSTGITQASLAIGIIIGLLLLIHALGFQAT